VDEAPPAVIREALKSALRPESRSSAMPTAADVLRAEALQEVLLEQLQIKFGAVDAAMRTRVEAADKLRLREWLRRLVSATSLAALFED
jgi:hypothetical protein